MRKWIRKWEDEGWTVTSTKGGHLKLTHPKVSMPIFTGSTPSDSRSIRNHEAFMKKCLAQAETK